MTISFAERGLSPEQIQRVATNYLRCLNLPPKSQVLIIGDNSNSDTTDNILTRKYVSSLLAGQIPREGHRIDVLNFDNTVSIEDFRRQTFKALEYLNSFEGSGDSTTVVYLGDAWTNRSGMYHAAEDFGKKNNRIVRWAGSLGFSTGDARVMSEMSAERIEEIKEVDEKFGNFFKEKPQGMFEITTRGADGIEHTLTLSYDINNSPFESDVGQFDDEKRTLISPHIHYINIPGGEKYASPYPFQLTVGEFAAQGMLFIVRDGLVESIKEIKEGALNSRDPRQKQLVEIVNNGRKIPVSELGLGYYALVGIKTYSDSSILSAEKAGPHIGFAHAPGESTEEAIMAEKSGDFHHTDFVLDYPVITWFDIGVYENREQFYPPPEK